ncbi:MAG: type II toxin-antitoxin system Phd/YefM family antitoxin [Gemmatimonadales bacterium]|jgi:prevent-host-death family protein
MRAVSSTEFRQNVFSLLSAVENGERVLVTRHGRVVAELAPPAKSAEPAWKRTGPRLRITGAAVSAAILRERSR